MWKNSNTALFLFNYSIYFDVSKTIIFFLKVQFGWKSEIGQMDPVS